MRAGRHGQDEREQNIEHAPARFCARVCNIAATTEATVAAVSVLLPPPPSAAAAAQRPPKNASTHINVY